MFQNILFNIAALENNIAVKSSENDIDKQVNLIFLKQGAQIASQIEVAFARDNRFKPYDQKWYLSRWIHNISTMTLRDIHRKTWKSNEKIHLSQFRELIQDLPDGEIGDMSIVYTIEKALDLFQFEEDGWRAVKQPPPIWEKAQGSCFVYDPETYTILLQPGQRLKKVQAERLQSLGLYDDMVESIS